MCAKWWIEVVKLPGCEARIRADPVPVSVSEHEQCSVLLESHQTVYRYDEVARAAGMSGKQRPVYRREHSRPVMDEHKLRMSE